MIRVLTACRWCGFLASRQTDLDCPRRVFYYRSAAVMLAILVATVAMLYGAGFFV